MKDFPALKKLSFTPKLPAFEKEVSTLDTKPIDSVG